MKKITQFFLSAIPIFGYGLGFYMLGMQNWRIALGVFLVALGIITSLYTLVNFVGQRILFALRALENIAKEPPDKIIK